MSDKHANALTEISERKTWKLILGPPTSMSLWPSHLTLLSLGLSSAKWSRANPVQGARKSPWRM